MSQYTIGEISEKLEIPASTLRYYEEIGILTNVKRTKSGQRIYEECHMNRLKTILCFKCAGFSISQLQHFFLFENAEKDNIDEILNLLYTHKTSIEKQMSQLQEVYVQLVRKIHYYNGMKKAYEQNEALPEWDDYKDQAVINE